MKYKNQLIVGSSILVIILAVFLGTRLIGNVTQDDNVLGNGTIGDEISDIADDGIINDDKVDGNKVDKDKNIENTNKDTKEDKETESTNEEKDSTSMMDDKENDGETNKEADDKNEIKDEKTSKSEDKDGNTEDQTKDSDKELEQSKGENVVYVFKNKYVVQPKETLSDITEKCLLANKLEISNNIYFDYAKELISKVNNIADPDLIITGSEMFIPTKANFKGLLPTGEAYTVQSGDTLHNIVMNKMSWCNYYEAKDLLMKNNNITNGNSIQAGMTIYIPEENGEV